MAASRAVALVLAAALAAEAQTLYPLQLVTTTNVVTATSVSVTVESADGSTYAVPAVAAPGPGPREVTVQTPFAADKVRAVTFTAGGGKWEVVGLMVNQAPWVVVATSGITAGATLGSGESVQFVNLAAGPMVLSLATAAAQYSGTGTRFRFSAVAATGAMCSKEFDAGGQASGKVADGETVVLVWWCAFRPEQVEELQFAGTGGSDGWTLEHVYLLQPQAQNWCEMKEAGTGNAQVTVKYQAPPLPDAVTLECGGTVAGPPNTGTGTSTGTSTSPSTSTGTSPSTSGCRTHETKEACAEEYACSWSKDGDYCYKQCAKNYFGVECEGYCEAKATCSGKGSCGADGSCQCKKGWGGPDCSLQQHQCAAWGDPHYTTFNNQKYNFMGQSSPQEPAYLVYSTGRTTLVAMHYRCKGTVSKPKTCMSEVQITTVSGTKVTVRMGVEKGPDPETGVLHVVEPDGTRYDVNAAALTALPAPVGDTTLTKYKGKNGEGEFTLALPPENGAYAVVRILQDLSKDKPPSLNVYIDHYGSLDGASGLCTESCGKSDCTAAFTGKFVTDPLPDPQQPPDMPETQGCDANPLGQAWAAGCCAPLRSCAGEELYNQCVFENCHMAWTGTQAQSTCIGSFAVALLQQRLCENELCPGNTGGPGCSECQQGYTGPNCTIYCDPLVTCNGHGTCNGNGGCWCEEGYSEMDESTGIMCQMPGAPRATLAPPPPPTPAPTPAPTPVPQPAGTCDLYEICTGKAACCPAGTQCIKHSKFFSQCRSNCPAGWACATETPEPQPQQPQQPACLQTLASGAPCMYSPLCCPSGTQCYSFSSAFAQCLDSCDPESHPGWACSVLTQAVPYIEEGA